MHFLITAGGTREYIDPVRFISNASSGRMGYALARAALKAGHKVTLITAQTSLKSPKEASVIRIETAAQMFEEVKKHFEKCDCLIMAAAVADYTPEKKSKLKLKKQEKDLTIKLKPTVDILKWAGKHKKVKSQKVKGKKQIIVGFALEDKNLLQNAEKKLLEKNLDMIVANDISAIESRRTTVNIKTASSNWHTIKNATKTSIAKRIIYLTTDLLE
jgi:phosphopantothenoylcysteine decarboxylase/phosphopantothenate--cysteine ligase